MVRFNVVQILNELFSLWIQNKKTKHTTTPCVFQHKKAVVVTSRVHPGESNSSWMMKGFLDYLTGSSADAKVLLRFATVLLWPENECWLLLNKLGSISFLARGAFTHNYILDFSQQLSRSWRFCFTFWGWGVVVCVGVGGVAFPIGFNPELWGVPFHSVVVCRKTMTAVSMLFLGGDL